MEEAHNPQRVQRLRGEKGVNTGGWGGGSWLPVAELVKFGFYEHLQRGQRFIVIIFFGDPLPQRMQVFFGFSFKSTKRKGVLAKKDTPPKWALPSWSLRKLAHCARRAPR